MMRSQRRDDMRLAAARELCRADRDGVYSRSIEVSRRVCSKSHNCGSYFDLFRGFGGSSPSYRLR